MTKGASAPLLTVDEGEGGGGADPSLGEAQLLTGLRRIPRDLVPGVPSAVPWPPKLTFHDSIGSILSRTDSVE